MPDALPHGTRIRVTGGPWPARIGCVGTVVMGAGKRVYPWERLPDDHVVVLLDVDPVKPPEYVQLAGGWRWTCCIRSADVEPITDDPPDTVPRSALVQVGQMCKADGALLPLAAKWGECPAGEHEPVYVLRTDADG